MADRIILARGPDRVIVAPSQMRVVMPPRTRVVVGARGRPGINGAGFEHLQSSPSAEWIVNHNLGFRPSATVLSAGGVEVLAQVVHASTNQLRVIFTAPQTGSVRCI